MIKISYQNGRMMINMNEFFPAPQKEVKKLMKVIKMDWDNGPEIKAQIVQHLFDRMAEEPVIAVKNRLKKNAQLVQEFEI